jgi:hypothetical protein
LKQAFFFFWEKGTAMPERWSNGYKMKEELDSCQVLFLFFGENKNPKQNIFIP